MTTTLFEPFKLGQITLTNRVVMAPMTRCRATPDHIPTPIMVDYYGQRAEAGLIVAEGTSPSPNGLGYARIPGLYTQAHVEAWRPVTEAVHERGGHIFLQLMHTGRVSHPLNMPEGARILAPSAVGLEEQMWTDQEGLQPYPVPSAMNDEDILHTIEEYATSAQLAIEAGFDGVELHGANGYLIEQFLNVATNRRTDSLGGTVDNRARFAIVVAKAVSDRIGANRTGIRLSPYGVFNATTSDPDTDALYIHLAAAFRELELAYVHIVDHSAMGAPEVPWSIKDAIREGFGGAIILSGGYDAERANADLAAGRGQLVAFGRPFISNPDLVQRLKLGGSLTTPDDSTFYTPGEQGYTDYPLAD